MPEDGDVVTVHYRGTLDGGEEFDSSHGRSARTFVIGRGQLVAGFEAALRGMSAGETVHVRLEAEQAYGPHRDELVFAVPPDEAPSGLSPGDEVQLAGGAPAVVVGVTAETVRLDANHPLAGQALNFEIELLSVRPADGS